MIGKRTLNTRLIYEQFSKLALCLSVVVVSLGSISTANAIDVAFTIRDDNPFTLNYNAQDIGDEFFLEVINDADAGFLSSLILRWDQVAINTSEAPETVNGWPVQFSFFTPGVAASANPTIGADYFLLDISFTGRGGLGMGQGALEIDIPWENFNSNNDFSLTVCANSGTCSGTSPVPVPAAAWLFGTGLLGLIGFSRRKIKQ